MEHKCACGNPTNYWYNDGEMCVSCFIDMEDDDEEDRGE